MALLAQFVEQYDGSSRAQFVGQYLDDALTTTLRANDFDSASPSGATVITDAATTTPTITIAPAWRFNAYIRVTGVNGKTPDVVADFVNNIWEADRNVSFVGPWWRYYDDGTGSQVFPDSWNQFDNNSKVGDTYTCSNNAAFTEDEIEICVSTQRWRYMDTKRLIENIDGNVRTFELGSSIAASSLDKHVHDTINVTSATRSNTAPYSNLNLYCIGLEDTTVSPAGGAEKLNIVCLIKQHAMEDQGAYAGWSFVNFFINGTGTTADWLRQHCILHCYDVNPAGQFYGNNRAVTENGTNSADPNRQWISSSSAQVTKVRSAINSDVSRLDVLFDWHGFHILNRGGDEFGIYEQEPAGNDGNWRVRVNSLTPAGIVFGDAGTSNGAFAEDWGRDVKNAQLSLTLEFSLVSPNPPRREDMYDYIVEDIAGALELMVDNSELTLTAGAAGTITVDSAALVAQAATTPMSEATRTITASGTLDAQDVPFLAYAQREITSSAVLVSQQSTTSGSSDPLRVASGALGAQQATMAGTASRVVTATGTPAAQDSDLAATIATTQNITSSGALQAQAPFFLATVGINGEFPSRSGWFSAQISTSRQH